MKNNQKWVRREASLLIDLAQRLKPEGEGLDLTDHEYALNALELHFCKMPEKLLPDQQNASL